MKSQLAATTATPTTSVKKESRITREIENDVDHIECVDTLLSVATTNDQVNALFNLLLKTGQSPQARQASLHHIVETYMGNEYLVH
jgi:hypothetical protein